MSLTKKEIEGRLADWLEREAGRVGSGESFTPGAYVLARRRRTRKRVGALVTGVAVAAALLPAGLWINGAVNRAERTPDVANTVRTTNAVETPGPRPSTSTSNPKSAGPIEKTIDPAKLTRGEPPHVPWYADGAIHDGGQVIPLPADMRGILSLTQVDGGFVIEVDRPNGNDHTEVELVLIRPGVAPKSLGKGSIGGVAVSGDRRQLAWSARKEGRQQVAEGSTLHLADARTGEVLHTKTTHGREDTLSVDRFLGSSVIVERSPNESLGPIRLWDPSSGRISDWYDAKDLVGLTPDGSIGAVSTDENVENACFAVRTVPEGSELWSSCEFDGTSVVFSPDGRRAAAFNYDQVQPPSDLSDEEYFQWLDDHPAISGFFVKDARTGTNALRLNGFAPEQIVWETSGTFVFRDHRYDPEQELTTSALVRCTVEGECELATEYRKRASRFLPVYALPGNDN